jgi:ankyrin repeat protein
MTDELPVDEAKQLVGLCAAGRLYAVEEWVRTGRSLQVPPQVKKTPLAVAMDTGFHSLIDLLLRHAPDPRAKNQTLHQAVHRRRLDLIELAVAHGAEITSVPFVDVLMTGDRPIIALFLENGADPITDSPFAWAFYDLRAKTTLGTYLDLKRQRPELGEGLQAQADMALRQFCHEGQLKWVSLLMWAGADPRSRGPRLEDIDDPDMDTTAFHEACVAGYPEILRRLKPDPARDDLGKLLEEAAFFARREPMTYLLSIGANPNNKANGGSGALEACLRHLGWADFDRVLHHYGAKYQTPSYKVSNTREAIRLLVDHGALWRPDPSTLNDVRRILYKIEPDLTVELVGLLTAHTACDAAFLHELLRTPRMQEHLASCEREMARLGLTLDGRRKSEVKDRRPPRPSPYVLANYNREKLYREVWAEPTQKVAARYGISDVALAKACRQLRIPKPPRGYWAKKEAGRPVERRPKLPPLET